MFNYAIQDFIEKIDEYNDLDQYEKHLHMVSKKLGFDHVAYLGVSIPESGLSDPFTLCTYGQDWVTHYVEQDFLNIDPVVFKAINSSVPYDWGQLSTGKNDVRFFGEASEYGIGNKGLTIPIRGKNGEFALFNVSSTRDQKEWDANLSDKFQTIFTISSFYHDSLVNNVILKDVEKIEIHLTARERECLLWTARGKSSWDIGGILHLSERTVNFHLQNACSKLNVKGKHHAVVKSILQHLIHP